MRHLLLLAILLTALSCTAAPVIEPAPERAPLEQRAGQNPPNPGYCVEYTVETCDPPSADARAMCARLYGETYGTAMECWQSSEAVLWGCVPVCGQAIVCPGAEGSPSALWCCPW